MPILSTPECQLTLHRAGAEVLVSLLGRLRLDNGEAVKAAVIALFDTAPEVIYLQLSQLTELDSAGLGVLVGLHMTGRNRKVQIKLLAPTAFVARLLESTRLTSVLTIIAGTEAEMIRTRLEQPTFLAA